MRRSRAARNSAPPPTMPASAERSPLRSRRPMKARMHEHRACHTDAWQAWAHFSNALRASRHRARGGPGSVGARGAAQRHPALRAAGAVADPEDAGDGLGRAVAVAAGHAAHHARRFCLRRRWGHCAGAVVQPVALAGIFAISLCRHSAGHAGDRNRAAAADLSAAADRGGGLRLDRRVLPGAVQHRAWTEFGRPQSRRPVPALSCLAPADAASPETAGGAALCPGRPAHCRRPVADRCGGCGNRRGLGGRGLRARLSYRGIRLSSEHTPYVCSAAATVGCRDCHLCLAGASFPPRFAALERECAWKGKLMAANISSEKIDLLIYGPIRPILENGFPDQYVVHRAESHEHLDRLSGDVKQKLRGMAVTYHTMHTGKDVQAQFPKLEMIASFGVGYDHIDSTYAREHNIIVTNTPDVLTEEVADVAMGLLIATLREFVKADKYLDRKSTR